MFEKTRENKILFFSLALTIGIIAGLLVAVRFDLSPKITAATSENALAVNTNTALNFENAFIEVAGAVGKAVVSISAERTTKIGGVPRIRRYSFRNNPSGRDFNDDLFDRFFGDFFGDMPEREFKQRGLGSGVIIDKEGYILTNEHVVQGADKITVTLPDGREFKGAIKGTDQRSDLAVIKINATDLPVAKFGNSDNLKIGQWSIAIGNPFGYMIHSPEPTVTVGVVSALHRSLPGASMRGERDYSDLIQTDAAINPGNSGGPLVNLSGEIIGINVAIFSTTGGYQGVGFAIPSNVAKKVLSRLIQGKKITYGWLGVSVQNIDDKLAKYFNLSDKEGALIGKVLKDSPAEKSGLKEGDLVISFDAQKIKNVRELVRLTGNTEVGKKVKIGIIRDKREKTVEVVMGSRPESATKSEGEPESAPVEPEQKAWRGISVEEITPELAKRNNLEDSSGVIIAEIEPGSLADEAGLEAGDIIYSINKKPIKNLTDYRAAIKDSKGECLISADKGYIVLPEK